MTPTLRRFAAHDHPAIRALLLRRLPYLQYLQPELGWELFSLAMQKNVDGLWVIAEKCLYYTYYRQYEMVAPWLAQLYREGCGEDLQTWGRISALAALSGHVDFAALSAELMSLNDGEAWRGAASVWAHPSNLQQHREQCFAGIEAGLSVGNPHAMKVAQKISGIFRMEESPIAIPQAIIQRYFALLKSDSDSSRRNVYGIDGWLNAIAGRDPLYALEVVEIYLDFVKGVSTYLHDHHHNLTQLLTCLFSQAEEQEESDSGAMLQRVVALQDTMLALGVSAVNDWLKAAERA